MLIVKDAMVLIHLAKISLLEKSCGYFKEVITPRLVYEEVMEGLSKGYADARVVENLVNERKLRVVRVKDATLVKKANEFNIKGGEAEAVALYWQEKAEMLATDDDNVRKKAVLIDVRTIGTLAIVLRLKLAKLIDYMKFKESITELRKIGWFGDAILDKALMEGTK
ncbi:hypothetical protein HYU40_03910 [Candidatus Woesearchaeota archaeon]|nr:hypothetical protein [Candidatus Woesearchaeota archaeon]